VSNDIADDKIFQLAETLIEEGIFSVVLTGGEPLMRKNVVKQVTRYLKSHNVEVMLNTNLVAMDKGTLDELLSSNLDGMLISCPSVNPELYHHMTGGGVYQHFENNLKLLVSTGMRFSVNMVVNKRNLGLIRETAEKMHGLGVKSFGATPMGLNSQSPDLKNFFNNDEVNELVDQLIQVNKDFGMNVDIFEALPKCAFKQKVREGNWSFLKRRCQAGKTIVSISNNGDVRPCSHNNQSYGNLFTESLTVIWKRMEEWRGYKKIPMQCIDCESVKSCFGGCRITAETITKNSRGLDPWMTNPIKTVNQRHLMATSALEPQTKITPSKIFRWRKEGDDAFLVTSARGGRNMTMINEQYFQFLVQLRDFPEITISSLATKFGVNFGDDNYQRIIAELASRKLIEVHQ